MEELIYTIDKALSDKDNALVIKIQPAIRANYSLVPAKGNEPLSRQKLEKLSTIKDSGLIPFLIKEEMAYAKKTLGRILDSKATFENVHVSSTNIAEGLKLLAMSGKLYFNNKLLAVDLFGKTTFYYKNVPGNLQAFIKMGESDFPIESCDFIGRGPPHWFIKGIHLKYIATEISWKDLKSAFEGQYRPLDELIVESKEDPEAPQVVGDLTLIDSKKEPLPLLILKDRLGSFADLWMDYGEGSVPVPYHDPLIHVEQSGKNYCKRVLPAEQGWEKDLLETGFIKKSMDNSRYYCALDKVAKSLAFLLEIGWQVRDMKGNAVVKHQKTELQADATANEIIITGKVHFDAFQADLSNVVGAFNRRERFVQMATGHVALLPDSMEQLGLANLAEEAEIVGDSLRFKKCCVGALSELFGSHPQMGIGNNLTELKQKIETFQGISTAEPGPSFCGQLRGYQQEGLNWLNFLFEFGFHGLLADDMGLGKTVQVLAFLSKIELTSPVLIVVPTSLIFNWKKEIEKFLPGTPFLIHHGLKRTPSREILDKPQLIVTTYATTRLDNPLLAGIEYTCLILDEAQAVKNAETQTAQALKRLSSRFRLSISGTPIENHISELWSHFNFLMPELFGEEATFNAEVQAGLSDPRFLKRIKNKIRPFVLRRQKNEVAKDLPEKIEQTVWVEMHPSQRKVYEQFLSGIRSNLISKVSADGVQKHRMEILEAIMRLRQICCHPLLAPTMNNDEVGESAKFDVLIEDVKTVVEENRKVLIYSQFTSMLALIAKQLRQMQWEFAYLDGTTQNREKVVTQFQQDPNLKIFLISLKAGGIGLNLTAADYVFLYDPWWNAAAENQAIDRAHRIGRHDTVIAKRYIMAESIEEKMMKLKALKSTLAADIIDNDGLVGTSLHADDLLFLLS